MSSDYLNYELSKELHDLGVVLGKKFPKWAEQRYWAKDSGLLFPMEMSEFKKVFDCSQAIFYPAPSTAQLIDEILKHSTLLYLDYEKSINCYCVEVDNSESKDPCATTALGKALIALVKEDRKCQK